MAVSESYQTFIKDQLSEFDGLEMKKMFGGIGCFKDGIMFAMIDGKETFRLRVGDDNKQAFEDRGMQPYQSDKKKKGMPYWEVPADVLEDKKALAQWAEDAFEVAKKAKKK